MNTQTQTQTQSLADSLKQALGIDPAVVVAKTPKAKAEVKTPEQKADDDVSVYFTEQQVANLVEFAELGIDAEAANDSIKRQMVTLFHSTFPKGTITYNQWRTISVLYRNLSVYLYDMARLAVRLMPGMGAVYVDGECTKLGELPAKNGGTKKGTRAFSVAKWSTTFGNHAKQLRADLKAIPKSQVEPETFATIVAAIKELDAIRTKVLRKVS